MQRVLFVSHTSQWGGGSEVVLEHSVAAASRAGFVPSLVCPAGTVADRMKAAGTEVFTIPMPAFRRSRDPRLLMALGCAWGVAVVRLLAVIVRLRPRLVHANSGIASLTVCVPCTVARCPLVWHQHDIIPNRLVNRLILRFCGALTARILACSAVVAESLSMLGIAPSKITTVHNAVTDSFFAPLPDREECRTALHLPTEGQLISVVGRLVPRKGQDLLIDALGRLDAAGFSAHLAIAGETPGYPEADPEDLAYRVHLRQIVARHGLTERVHFLGYQSDIHLVYGASDVVAMPSTGEPFGLAVTEAFASGVPVVATRSGGHGEIIDNGVTGLLVPPGDPDALASALHAVLVDSELRDRLIARARLEAYHRFSQPAFAETLVRVYSQPRIRHTSSKLSLTLGAIKRMLEHGQG
jgi:glycosyltransferase involved in cell wall biosynthesis